MIQLSGEGETEDRTNTELKALTGICNVQNAAGHLSWEWNTEICNNRELLTVCLPSHPLHLSPTPQPSSLLWGFLLVPKNSPIFPCLHPKQEYNRLQTSHSVKKNLKAQQGLAQDHKSWGEDGVLALRGVSLHHTLTAEPKAFPGHSCSLAWASMDCTQFLLHHQFLPPYLSDQSHWQKVKRIKPLNFLKSLSFISNAPSLTATFLLFPYIPKLLMRVVYSWNLQFLVTCSCVSPSQARNCSARVPPHC